MDLKSLQCRSTRAVQLTKLFPTLSKASALKMSAALKRCSVVTVQSLEKAIIQSHRRS